MRKANWRRAALVVVALACHRQAIALVGPTGPGRSTSAHVVMVLASERGRAGFCSAVVVSQDIVLTAAHCVKAGDDLRLFYRTEAGAPVLVPIAAVARHPGFRSDAVQKRERSIDLALVRTARPLPERFSPIALDKKDQIAVGERFLIAGFGVGREGAAQTSGTLRSGVVAARAPLSSILLWAEDPTHRGLGACTGDSGGPVLTPDGSRLVAIMDWASGAGGRACGALTQATLVAPQRKWIEAVLREWGTHGGE